MTLTEHCEPIFQFVCRLKRIAQNEKAFHTTLSIATVRKDVDRLFRKFEYAIINDEEFEGDPDQIKTLLHQFTDVMISEAQLNISPQWEADFIFPEEARSHNAETLFFQAVEQWLEDTSLDANEHLLFFHTCLGLGFAEQSARTTYKNLVSRLDERVDKIVAFNPNSQLSKSAYDFVNQDNYVERPLPKLAFYSLTLVALFAVIIFTIYTSYTSAAADLVEAVNTIVGDLTTH